LRAAGGLAEPLRRLAGRVSGQFSEMRRGRRLALHLVLGLAAGLGQAPWDWPLLTLLALVAVMALARGATGPRGALADGFAFGLGYFGLALHWIVSPFLVDVARHGWMAPFALLFMASGAALFWALAFGLARWMRGGTAGLVATLAGVEALRSLIFTGFPWALIGHTLIDTPYAQLAAWVGPHGLTLAVLGTAAVILWLGARPALVAVPVALAGLWIALDPGPAEPAPEGAPVVRLVQPNAVQSQKWDPEMMGVFYGRLLAMTATGPVPDLVVWPETAVPWLLEQAQGTLAEVARAARGAPVVLGIQRREGTRYYNSLVVTLGDGEVAALYDKAHLVPFGEYIPYGEWLGRFGIQGLAASAGGGFSAGPGPAVIDLPGIGPALPLICYEGIFAEEVNAAPRRPRLMLLITNDAWFGEVAGPYQHFAQARLRAIEQGLPMVRVANTGVSGMIDARGRVTGQIALGQAAFLDLPLPAALPPTPYSRTGDWPALAVMVFLQALALIRGRTVRAQIVVDPDRHAE